MGRTGLFGGTFDPIHSGHVRALKEFIRACALDRTIVMPACVPPHKEFAHTVSDEDRLHMVRLAVGGLAHVSDYELVKGGKSYTIDTLCHLKSEYPGDELWLYVGSDMLKSMDGGWYRIGDILSLAAVFCISRNEGEAEALSMCAERLASKYGAKIVLSQAEPLPVSSTDLRRMIKEGRDVSGYIPAAVAEYIRGRGLYR